ncbi:hypothetical protein MKY96_32670 [Paenibacillus sp. FSL R7-0302]|uniref:hypothetical protein n=1 Tax=Paenibacillus sp. FSL R7-0302 TaxID=2921681 RepID=UPI0030FAAF7E
MNHSIYPMDLKTPIGSKVVYAFPDNGLVTESARMELMGLIEGEAYTVADVLVHGWSSYVYLEEFPFESFNSVNFANLIEKIEEEGVVLTLKEFLETDEPLKVYVANFPGVWLGGEAIVVAKNKSEAVSLLTTELQERSLGHALDKHYLSEIDITIPNAYVINDGDY